MNDVPQPVKLAQRQASDPESSAWVRANAGAGKTYVLAQRVLRLLLGGTDPARILCITYTKAAAAEMANRVFAWLSDWATMEEGALEETLTELQGRSPTDEERIRARRLFAAAVETPGRLRVQTIHAFCERLLQQFPFEASVTAGFEVLDERASSEIMAEARADILRAAGGPGSALAGALERLAAETSEDGLAGLIAAMIRRKGALREWIVQAGDLDTALAGLTEALGLGPEESEESIVEEILNGEFLPRSEWEAVAAVLETGAKTDCKAAASLRAAAEMSDAEALSSYLEVFLTQKGELRRAVATKGLCEKQPDLAKRLDGEKARLEALCDRLRAVRIRDASAALFRISDAVIDRYEQLKGGRGYLDYDDLIDRAAALLMRADAAWVLYKLDGGLDHVLVDEAQDTSPGQWQVVGAIIEEFFAGRGARPERRTLFAVGDEKQSIYSFQGADPRGFGEKRNDFGARIRASGQSFSDVPLRLSFRSTPAILAAVDLAFAGPARVGLSPADHAEPIQHDAIRARDRGRIELWPPVSADPQAQPEPWDAPFDVERSSSPAVQLADRIARTIRSWIDSGETLEGSGRPIRAGDVMILVRNRRPFAEPMIRALKEYRIPVAGADRLVLTDHIAVMDLIALGRFCLLPEDDLNLAALLKSPLIGMSEDDLMAVAIERTSGLWRALREHGGFPDAVKRLRRWRSRAGIDRPYEFYGRILGAERMREAFHRRLGAEAFEALDEFLSLALAYERVETPTLAGFLNWLTAAPSEVKRDMDKGRDEVRVMTVHGAKGLEAPIVFLPDTMRPNDARQAGALLSLGEEAPGLVWVPRKSDDCLVTGGLRDAEIARRAEEEHRLLYVAMTRAEERLYVGGFQNNAKPPEGCWYELIEDALSPILKDDEDHLGNPTRVYADDLPAKDAAAEDGAPERASAPLPEWIGRDAAPETETGPRAASHLVDHAPPEGEQPGAPSDPVTRREARRRGVAMHRLFEVLPDLAPDRRREMGARILRTLVPDWPEERHEGALAEVLRVLDHPDFGEVFRPGGRAELSIGGYLPNTESPVIGQIDRLWLGAGEALVVDFKTDRAVPETPEAVSPAYLAQLGAYRALLARIHPDKTIRCALLWTAGPALMEVPDDLLASHGALAPA